MVNNARRRFQSRVGRSSVTRHLKGLKRSPTFYLHKPIFGSPKPITAIVVVGCWNVSRGRIHEIENYHSSIGTSFSCSLTTLHLEFTTISIYCTLTIEKYPFRSWILIKKIRAMDQTRGLRTKLVGKQSRDRSSKNRSRNTSRWYKRWRVGHPRNLKIEARASHTRTGSSRGMLVIGNTPLDAPLTSRPTDQLKAVSLSRRFFIYINSLARFWFALIVSLSWFFFLKFINFNDQCRYRIEIIKP